MNERVTMATVAKQAGVHPTTVSLALRNHPSLPPATRQRLQDLAEQMGFKRDPALSALVAYRLQARPRTGDPQLAYITNWDTRWGWKDHPAHQEFFDGATERASTFGFRLTHFWLGEPGLTHRRMSRILISRGIAGLIIASHRSEHSAPLDFDWPKFSAVKIDFSPREQQLHLITNDQRTIIGLAMQRVLGAGYRRIGLVMPYWWDDFVDLAWSAGFLAEQQLIKAADRIPILYYSTPLRPTRISTAGPDFVVPSHRLAKWLKQHRPEVLLSYGPFVRPSLAELGLAVPKDLAFVETFLLSPDGTTAGVRQNCRRVGELAVEILEGQLHHNNYGVPSIPTATLVEGTWHDGASLPPRPPPATPVSSRTSRDGRTEPRVARIAAPRRQFTHKPGV